jgi:aspartate dehydrogenase
MESIGTARPLRLAIAGLGAIGLEIARRVDAGEVEGMVLSAVAARDHAKAERRMNDFVRAPAVIPLANLAQTADVIVECAPAAVFLDIARPALEQGRLFMPLSVGVLLDNMQLVDLARRGGGRILVPSGAILGLDALKAVAKGSVDSIKMVTRKPPGGLAGAPYLEANAINLADLTEARLLFSGTAREAAKGFPANLNVCAAIALAGIGPDKTMVEVWADPAVRHNTHTIEVKSDSSDFTMTIRNTPTLENPRTGKITALSVVAALERLTAPLAVGT